MKYLLDTNICVALMRRQPAALLQRLIAHPPGVVGVSTITVAELAHGAERSARPDQNRSALAQFLLPLEIAAFDYPAALAYGRLRARLESGGQTIGGMDLLIAAHALALDLTLITNNLREFQRVPALPVEAWLSPDQ